jgi:hypothetical protein
MDLPIPLIELTHHRIGMQQVLKPGQSSKDSEALLRYVSHKMLNRILDANLNACIPRVSDYVETQILRQEYMVRCVRRLT